MLEEDGRRVSHATLREIRIHGQAGRNQRVAEGSDQHARSLEGPHLLSQRHDLGSDRADAGG